MVAFYNLHYKSRNVRNVSVETACHRGFSYAACKAVRIELFTGQVSSTGVSILYLSTQLTP